MNGTGVTPHAHGLAWRIGRWLEDAVLVLLLTAMISLAATQILLRNVFDSGLVWADELLRILVLWVGLAGALAASRDRNQIRIDVLSRFLGQRGRLIARVVTNLFTAAVCAVVAWHAFVFVGGSLEFGDTLLGNLPAWWFQLILPGGFFLMAWRYLVHAADDLRALLPGPSQ